MRVAIPKNIVIAFVIGCIFGLSVSLFTINLTQYLPIYNTNILRLFNSQWFHYNLHPSHGRAHMHEDLEDAEGPRNESNDEDLVARQLSEKVKVLCWVMTQPKNHKSKVWN